MESFGAKKIVVLTSQILNLKYCLYNYCTYITDLLISKYGYGCSEY